MAAPGSSAAVQVVLLGRPGSGKGTQGVFLSERLGVPHLSAGDLLRGEVAARTAIGRAVEAHLEAGTLAPDVLVLRALEHRLMTPEARGTGFVLDGYPRSIRQLQALERLLAPEAISCAVELHVGEATALRRLAERGRSDDAEAVTRRRMCEYVRSTGSVLESFARRGLLVRVAADRPVPEVTAAVLAALRRQLSDDGPGETTQPGAQRGSGSG